MLDDKYVKAYKSIKTTDALKERIKDQADVTFRNEKGRSNLILRKITAVSVAACAALAIGIGTFTTFFGPSGRVEVLYNDSVITEKANNIKESGAKAVSFGRESLTTSGLPLEIKTDVVTKVSVTEGELYIFDESYDELLFIGTNFTTSKDVLVYWNLSGATESELMLIIDSDNEHSVYTLEESKERGYIIKLAESEKKE
ncbi:MAG: hypothetical protein IKL36_08780 [Clostridia bacterium]|nr:hypothetical protein [Clostridia bacterium]